MAETQPITKIYRIVVEGFEESKAEIQKMSLELAKLKKAKQDLDKELAKATKPEQVTQLNQKIQAQVILEANLTKQIQEKNRQLQINETLHENNGAEGIGAAITAYQSLIAQYKEALANSQAMEAQFGKESAEAIEAARTAAIYEAELEKINRLRSTPTISTPAADVPFTSNLAELEAEQAALRKTGTALSEFDLQQQAAANEAVVFGGNQRQAGEETESTIPALEGISTAYEQYTRTIRDNIKSQIEITQALAANRAEQKELEAAIKSSENGATSGQIERLAQLKEEALILDQTNKEITTTIRNQAKEYISATGSGKEAQAQLNQLQETYLQLSETERAQPFGLQLKRDIDVLEPKVKELEGTIGRFQRNVGNYPSNFTGAFKVLETELDVLQGKLVQGNFTGKEFDQLTKRTAVLNEVTQSLNTTFKTTAQEQNAFKEAARQVGTTFGTESVVFQNFTKEVGAGNARLKETDIALNAVSGSGNKAGNVFKNLFGVLRQAANILPGIGLSGLILLLITPLEALASKVADYVSNIGKATNATEDFKAKTEAMNLAVHESQSEFVKAYTNVETLRDNVEQAKKGFIKKDDVLKLYNDTLGKTTGHLTNFNEIEDVLIKKAPAYIQVMALRAAATLALEAAAKKAHEAAEAQRKDDLEFSTFFNRFNTAVSSAPGFVPDNGAEERARRARLAAAKKAKEEVTKEAKDGEKLQLNVFQDLKKQADDLSKKYGLSFIPEVDKKKTKERADRLNVEEQNALKEIDATFKEELAVENTRVTEIEKVHQLTFDEEIRHAKRIEEITVNSLNSKIALLSKIKSKNAEELAELAEFKEKRSEIELQTSQKIQEIEKKRFADQNNTLKSELDANIKQAKEAQQSILDNPNTSNIERARANLSFIDTEIVAYQQYYNQLSELNSNYNKEELAKVREHLRDLEREKSGSRNNDLAATEKDLIARGQKDVQEINTTFQRQRAAILTNEKLTFDEKNSLIERLTSANNITILSKELETLNEQMKVKFQMLLTNNASEADYEKLRLATVAKNADLQNAIAADAAKKTKGIITDLKSFAANTIIKLFNLDVNTEAGKRKAQLLQETLTAAFATAQTAMTNFYDAEAAQIERSRKNNEKRLTQEFDQLKARSQSQAETESLEKQFQQRKEANDREAFEKNKKIQLAQAKINLAMQLSNLAVIAFAPTPPNVASLGVFGTIMYAVQAALALTAYALNVSRINSAQFEQGGQVPKRGGKFGGKKHSQGGTKFTFQDEQYEAEVDELAIIRTKNAPARNKVFQIVGTHQQIASQLNVIGGGVSFAPGAKLKRFETGGSLGSSLQAPVFISSNSASGGSSADNRELLEAIRDQNSKIDRFATETSKRFERIEVVQVTRSVTDAQKKQVQQKAIGSL